MSAPPSCRLRLGRHPKSAGTRGPSPTAAAPTCLWGRGRPGGPDVTGGLSQSELPFLSPKGIPGPQQGLGARPSNDDPQPGIERGPAPGRANRGWDPPERRRTRCAAAHGPGSSRAQRGAGMGRSHTAGQRGGEHGWVARRQRGRVSLPCCRRAPGTGSASAHLGAPRPSDPLQVSPGPLRPGAAAGLRWAEGVSDRGRPQNPHWSPPGSEQGGSAVLPNRQLRWGN